jgi:hypothetical protein
VRSGKNALLIGLFSGLIFLFTPLGLSGGVLGGVLFGMASGLAFGLVYGGAFSINYFSLRWLLSRQGCIPWNYVQFLNAAAVHILLQKVGGGYRFIHQEFLKFFALLDTNA